MLKPIRVHIEAKQTEPREWPARGTRKDSQQNAEGSNSKRDSRHLIGRVGDLSR